MKEIKNFNLEEFNIKLDTEILGRNFVYVEEVESTNALLLNSNDFNDEGTLVFAEFQLEGRGRLQRKWYSQKENNITFSLLFKDPGIKDIINILSLATSVAIAVSIENLYQLKVDLKWPNDVLIKGAKVAGILIESSSIGNRLQKIVVGIGINVNQPSFPGKYLLTPTSIKRELKRSVKRERLLSEFLNNYEEIIEICKSNPAKILNDWRNRCKMIGEKVKIIQESKGDKFGIFHDIDENGLLILKTKEGFEKINSGDVSLR